MPAVRKSAPTRRAEQAAAELMSFLAQFKLEEYYPMDLEVMANGDRRGTTLDGQRMTITAQRWDQALNAGRNGFPYFGRKETKDELLKLLRELEGANRPDDVDAAGFPLFAEFRGYFGFMMSIGEKILEGILNPPGLNLRLKKYAHRLAHPSFAYEPDGSDYRRDDDGNPVVLRNDRTDYVTWRFRHAYEGLVHHAYLAYVEEAERRKRGNRREFQRLWVDDFVAGYRSFELGGETKTFDDFVIQGRPGTPDEFRALWSQVSSPNYKSRGPDVVVIRKSAVPTKTEEV